MWIRLARANKEPSSVMKFSIGMALVALSFVVMLPTLPSVMHGGTTSGGYLILLYLLYTCAELCISPVGLSSMSKLAPPRIASMVMGTWFVGTSLGNYLAARAAALSAAKGYGFLFVTLIIWSLVVAAALFAVAPAIRRMLQGDSKRAELPKAIVEAKDAP